MAALGQKARKHYRDPDMPCPRPATSSANTALLECEPNRPPRLCRKDLKAPERFHQRLVEWLMKQR